MKDNLINKFRLFSWDYGLQILTIWYIIVAIVYLNLNYIYGFIMCCIAIPYVIYNLYLSFKYIDRSEIR